MKKTKKLLSLLTALAITASSFAAMVIPASAEVKYTLNVSSATTGDVTKMAPTEAEIRNMDVVDFGATVPALDGWGYIYSGKC